MKAAVPTAPVLSSNRSSSSSYSTASSAESAFDVQSSRRAAGNVVDDNSSNTNPSISASQSSDAASKMKRFQNPRKPPCQKGPRKAIPQQSRRADTQQFGSQSSSSYDFRSHYYHDQERNAVIFFNSTANMTSECNVDSPFYFEVSQEDLLLSEKTAQSLRQLYDSFSVGSEISNYIQRVAESCDTYLLLQQRNINEFYETRKRMEQSGASTPNMQPQPFPTVSGSTNKSGNSTSSS